VTPGYTASARSLVGEDTTLAVEQLVVVSTDPQRARAIARGPLGFLGKVPAYQASFRRMGFTDQEIAQLSDRLVDALVPWGSPDSVAAAITRQLQAGADHLAISVTADPSQPHDQTLSQWHQLAQRLMTA
jgi:probable F420-dependent oxidoreductase